MQLKHVGDQQYVIKYMLLKCSHWFTVYYKNAWVWNILKKWFGYLPQRNKAL